MYQAPSPSSRKYTFPNDRIMICTSSGSNTNFFKPRGTQFEINLIKSHQFLNRHISVLILKCNKPAVLSINIFIKSSDSV